MSQQYVRPPPPGWTLAQVDVIDRQIHDLNRIADEHGWQQANEHALAQLVGVAWWLTKVRGARLVDRILGMLAEQMVQSQRPVNRSEPIQ